MLTVQVLVEEIDLQLAAGGESAEAPVRWVHSTELADPTPWLSGGELILTTGIQLKTPAKQRDFLRRLADHQLAGLGFGTGFDHQRLPKALVNEARERSFPLFEVPYEMPFIAITEKAFGHLVNEQYEVLRRGIATQRRLERIVLDEQGLAELVRALAAAVGGTVMVLGARGETLAAKSFRRELPDDALAALREQVAERAPAERAAEFAPAHAELSGRSLALPVATHASGPPHAWLIAVAGGVNPGGHTPRNDTGGLGEFERLILQQAVTVVALELMRRRIMRDTERRLAGDLLAEALSGQIQPEELRTRLRPFGVGGQAAVLVFGVDDPESAAPVLERVLADADVGALVAPRGALACAVVDASDGDPGELAGRARKELARSSGAVRAAASRAAPTAELRQSFHEARCALEITALDNGSAPEVATYRDLGVYELLLSLQDDDALRLFCDSVLAPLESGEGEYGGELMRSLEAFIEQNGQWEKAARELYCHRHTLRYRIRRVEELTGRDLGSARDRIEFWLALRGREMLT